MTITIYNYSFLNTLCNIYYSRYAMETSLANWRGRLGILSLQSYIVSEGYNIAHYTQPSVQ